MSEIKCTYPVTNTWRESNYIEDRKIAKDIKVKKHQLMKQAIKKSKEPIDKGRYQMIERYYDMIIKRVL